MDAGGACGFGAAPMELNVAAVTADLFRHGHACGACYQVVNLLCFSFSVIHSMHASSESVKVASMRRLIDSAAG